MNAVLVDTCIWSLALRGKSPRDISASEELTKLIYAERAKIIGPIRQEVLSGYSDIKQYIKLKDKLMYFPNEPVISKDYLSAAKFSNLCRQKGIQGSHIDFLICAVANRLKLSIFSYDKDFEFYSQIIPITLHLKH
mgnify:CR=1 FL=1